MNQREIKFRAWDKEKKTMYYGWTISGDSKGLFDQGWFGNWVDDENSNEWETRKPSDVELMQFTGLHDKNGKEIYEGDIVKHTIARPYDTVSEVQFEDGRFCLGYSSDLHFANTAYRKDDGIHGSDEGVEVIGNIYESPDLLK